MHDKTYVIICVIAHLSLSVFFFVHNNSLACLFYGSKNRPVQRNIFVTNWDTIDVLVIYIGVSHENPLCRRHGCCHRLGDIVKAHYYRHYNHSYHQHLPGLGEGAKFNISSSSRNWNNVCARGHKKNSLLFLRFSLRGIIHRLDNLYIFSQRQTIDLQSQARVVAPSAPNTSRPTLTHGLRSVHAGLGACQI